MKTGKDVIVRFARRANRPVVKTSSRLAPDRIPKLVEAISCVEHDMPSWANPTVAAEEMTRPMAWMGCAVGLVLLIGVAQQLDGRDPVVSMVHFAESEEASAVATADSVTDALHGFLRAQSDEERLQYLRHTDESRSRILSAIQSTTWDFGAIEMIGDVMLVHDSGREIASVDVGFSNGLARTAVFELTADGPKLDWESFALHEQIGWEEFLDGTGEASFRIELTRGDYYNYNFGDQKLWTCFRLVNPKNSVACWGYTLSDGSDAHRLQQLLASPECRSGKSLKIKLLLRIEGDHKSADQRQVLIKGIESESWFSALP